MRLRWFSLLGSLLLVATIAVVTVVAGPHGAFAQASPQASPDVAAGPVDLPGFQQVAARNYSGDIGAILAAVATPATPGAAGPSVVTLTAVAIQFDSDADAASAYDMALKQLTGPASTGGIELAEVAVEGFSGKTNAYTASIPQGEGITLHQAVLITQDGPYIYEMIAVALSSTGDAQAIATDVAKAMIATPAGTGEATFVKDGTSSGGIWDKFPKAGDPVLQGLTPEIDDRSDPAL
jgi:hypothetical protein